MTNVGLNKHQREFLLTHIKLAECVSRIDALKSELAKYNIHALQKSAAVGADKANRIKVAALVRQYKIEQEKKAGLVGKFLWNAGKLGLQGMSGLGSVISKAYQGAKPGVQMAFGGAKNRVRDWANRPENINKSRILAAMGGLGAAAAAKPAIQGAQNLGSGIANTTSSALNTTGNYLSNLSSAPVDIAKGFGSAWERVKGQKPGASSGVSGGNSDYQQRYRNYRLRPNRI